MISGLAGLVCLCPEHLHQLLYL
uniref:Uncharacterized protein n=1 Tax=Rhizophora mucronata TaxID=61149 RepID=A0A2P2NE38_RHIMU